MQQYVYIFYLSHSYTNYYLYFKIRAPELKPNFVWFNPVLRPISKYLVGSSASCLQQAVPADGEAILSLNSLEQPLFSGYYKTQLVCILRTEFLRNRPQPNSLINCSLLPRIRESLRLLVILLNPGFKIFIKQGGI